MPDNSEKKIIGRTTGAGAKQPKNPYSAEGHKDTGGISHSPEENYIGDVMSKQDDSEMFSGSGEEGGDDEGFWKSLTADKKLLYSTLGVIFFLLLAIGIIYLVAFGGGATPTPPEVSLSIEQPGRVVSGQAFDITIPYSNKSDNRLTNVEMLLVFPSGYTWQESSVQPEDQQGRRYKLPDLEPGQGGQLKVTGIIDGQIGDRRDIHAALRYQMRGHNTVYESTASQTFVVAAPDLVLTLNGPAELIVGQEAIYTVGYRNVGSRMLEDVVVAITLPAEFKILSTEPEFSEAETWVLGNINPGATGSMRARGVYQAASTTQRVIEASAIERPTGNSVGRAFTVTDVGNSPLSVNQRVNVGDNGTASPGDRLRYDIDVENKGAYSLTNLVLSSNLSGTGYNMASLKTQGGVLSGNTITWTPGGVNELRLLRPNSKISVSYEIEVASGAGSQGEKSITLSSTPQVTSFELKSPMVSTPTVVKIGTQLALMQDVTYESGTWPMRVGSETRFRVSWKMVNTTNPVTDARVTAALPLGGESVVRSSSSDGTTIKANSSSSSIAWDIGTLPAGNQRSAYFIVSYTPSISDAGRTAVLARDIKVEGRDNFTNMALGGTIQVRDAETPGRVEG